MPFVFLWKQAPVFGTMRRTKNQYLAQSYMHTNTFTGTLLANVSTVNQWKAWNQICFLWTQKAQRVSSFEQTLVFHLLSFTSLYSLYTCERHSIRKVHKNTKGVDVCASSYIMYGNVNKRLLYLKVRIPVPGRIAEQWHFCTIGQNAQWQYFSDWPV